MKTAFEIERIECARENRNVKVSLVYSEGNYREGFALPCMSREDLKQLNIIISEFLQSEQKK